MNKIIRYRGPGDPRDPGDASSASINHFILTNELMDGQRLLELVYQDFVQTQFSSLTLLQASITREDLVSKDERLTFTL
jgi:hypothetical protein